MSERWQIVNRDRINEAPTLDSAQVCLTSTPLGGDAVLIGASDPELLDALVRDANLGRDLREAAARLEAALRRER